MPDTFFLSNATESDAPRGDFERAVVDEVWDLTEVVPGNDSALWRQDERGSTIRRSDYGKSASAYGWEIIEVNDGLKAVNLENL